MVAALMKELAPALEELVEREVERAVTRAFAHKTGAPEFSHAGGRQVWRRAYVAGLVYGQDTIVEHDGRLYRAMDATCETPGPQSRAWRVHAEAPC